MFNSVIKTELRQVPYLITCNFRTFTGSSLTQWKSIHRNCKGDRIHHFKCVYDFCHVSSCTCAWSSHYENDFHKPLRFTCPHNGVITGVFSEYSATNRDRRFGFRCCHSASYKAHTCSSTPYENDWDGDLDYRVEHRRYLVGVNSDHDNNHQDRRWSFHYCKVSRWLNETWNATPVKQAQAFVFETFWIKTSSMNTFVVHRRRGIK